MVFVDFSDAPANDSTTGLRDQLLPGGPAALGRFVLDIVGSFLSGARRCGGRRVNSRPFPAPGRAAADPGRRWRHRCRGR
jgi:hypothetical protein